MKKKILFVINSLECGGAEKSLVSLLTAIDKSKYDIYLQMFRIEGMFLKLVSPEIHILPEIEFLKSNKGSLWEQLKKPKFFCVRMRATIELRRNRCWNKLHDAQCYWKYTNKVFDVDKQGYDVAIAWGQGNPTHYVVEKVNAKKKIAFINADYEAVGHNKTFDYPFYASYNYIVTVSDKLAEVISGVFPEFKSKIKVIYDINNGKLIEQLAMQNNPFLGEKDEIKIVTVGRLVPPKGYDLAIEACRILCERDIKFKWFIVGDGPERNNIERDIETYGIGNYMILVGEKDNPYVYMKNADIYVQTSKFEGYCLTLGEARILNIPVVSTKFDVVYNQLCDEQNGLIVEQTGEAIANGIMRMLTDTFMRERIVDNLKREKKGNMEEIEKLYVLVEE